MKTYKNIITLNKNDRGIWDLDTSKGCSSGLQDNPKGCYDECYAAKSASIRGFDFSKTILRDFKNRKHELQIIKKINKIDMSFIRLGCSGDPSENWEHTFKILNKLKNINKEIVIITKHWTVIPEKYLENLKELNVCINTSVSAMDKKEQLEKCLLQYNRLKPFCKSMLRIVSCDFNKKSKEGLRLSILQDTLFQNENIIDTVFRVSKNNKIVLDKIINVKKAKFLSQVCYISKFNRKTYFGKCSTCIEQCGIFKDKLRQKPYLKQMLIWN